MQTVNYRYKPKAAIDRVIGYLSPTWAARRARSRAFSEYYNQIGMNASYRGAVSTRLDSAWAQSFGATGVHHLAKDTLEGLRDRTRQLDRDNTLASGLLDRSVENVIGVGMRLQVRTPDDAFNSRVEDMWAQWSETADIRGMMDFGGLQQQILRSHLRDGDIGIVLLGDGRLQPIEGDLIETPTGKSADDNVVDGVEISRAGRPIAFYIKDRTTGTIRNSRVTYTRILARDLVWLPRLRRLNSWRGEPVFASVLTKFDQIDGFIDGSVVAARMAANFGLLLKETSKSGFNLLPQVKDSDGKSRPEYYLEPGMVKRLGPTDEVTQVKPEHPSQSFPDFLAALLRFVGLNLGMPLELILMDFSRTNFSSARASLLQAQRSFRALQHLMISRVNSRIYRWRVSKWIKAGELPDPGMDENGNTIAWQHQWVPPGWQWVDPVKESQAIALKLDLGLTTLAHEASALGLEWGELLAARKRELDLMESMDIPVMRSHQTRDPVEEPSGQPSVRPPNQ
jgi:lambda family phage portal protein